MTQALPGTSAPTLDLPITQRKPARTTSWWLAGALAFFLTPGVQAQATGPEIINVGVGGKYKTLTAALESLPRALKRPYELRLLSGSTFKENVTIDKEGSNDNTLTIRPAAGATSITIEGTLAFTNSASYVTLSGHNGYTSRQLTVVQDNKFGRKAPAIVFSGDAHDNSVRDAKVLGDNASVNGGVIEIGAARSCGNDNNTFTGNYIASLTAGSLAANLVYVAPIANGVTNNGNSFIFNELANYAQCGISVGAGNGNGWMIRDNSFYYSFSKVPTTPQTAVSFLAGPKSNNNTISGNYIGGSAALATGKVWTNTSTSTSIGIVMSCGTAAGAMANVVQANVVRNISLPKPGGQAMQALVMTSGRVELANNTVEAVPTKGDNGMISLVSQAQTVLY